MFCKYYVIFAERPHISAFNIIKTVDSDLNKKSLVISFVLLTVLMAVISVAIFFLYSVSFSRKVGKFMRISEEGFFSLVDDWIIIGSGKALNVF